MRLTGKGNNVLGPDEWSTYHIPGLDLRLLIGDSISLMPHLLA